MKQRGRPLALDGKKRLKICALLSVGFSQNMAARYVSCAPNTIRNEAERDPKFAEELQQAKCNVELSLINNVRNAAKKEQYWRAAAWMLERGFPEKYAQRDPDVITAEQLAQILSQLAEQIVESVPVAAYRKNIVKVFESVARSFGQTIKSKMDREVANDSD